MSFERFIAFRLARSEGKSFAKVIIRIAIAAVAVSIAVMIITTAVITGFKNQITDKMFGFWGHIHITDTDINRNFEPRPILKGEAYVDSLKNIKKASLRRYNNADDLNEIQTISSSAGIKHVQAFAIAPGIITTKDDIEGILLKGVDKDFNWNQINNYIIRGKQISYEIDTPTDDLLISEETARRLQLEVGNRLIINFLKGRDQLKRRFTICGVYKTGLVEYDQRFALVDIRKVQNVLGWDESEIAGYEVFLDNIEDLDLINEYIYLDVLPTNLYSETIRSKFPAIFEWLELQNVNEDVILFLMIIVAMLNMVTALIILILEHTNMIGALKAMGSRNWSIRMIFLYHASYIILWGLIIGNVIGIGFCYLQKHFEWIKLDEKSYYLSVAPVELNSLSIFFTNFVTLLLILAFLIIPSYIVTRISPVRALHYK